MARPTSRQKTALSWAVTHLRERLDETMEQFARRMRVSLNTVSRWENSLPPTGKSLERLYRVAKRNGPATSAETMAEAIIEEKSGKNRRYREAQILDPINIGKAEALLEQLYKLLPLSDAGKLAVKRECVLNLADLLCRDGRKAIEREDGEGK